MATGRLCLCCLPRSDSFSSIVRSASGARDAPYAVASKAVSAWHSVCLLARIRYVDRMLSIAEQSCVARLVVCGMAKILVNEFYLPCTALAS